MDEISNPSSQGAGSGAQSYRQNVDQLASNLISPQTVSAPGPSVPQPEGRFSRLKWILVSILILVVLGVGGYFAYGYAFGPSAAWNKFVKNNLLTTIDSASEINFVLGYSDQMDNQFVNLAVKSNTKYEVIADQQVNSITKLSFKYDTTVPDAAGKQSQAIDDIEVRQIGKVAYINVNNIPFVAALINPEYQGWVKIDYAQLPKNELKNVSTEEVKKKFLAIIQKHKIFAKHKFAGKESLDGQQTYRYEITVDKNELNATVNEFIDTDFIDDVEGLGMGLVKPKVLGATTEQEKDDAKVSVKKYIDSLVIDKFNIWVNAKEKSLHQFELALKLPSPYSAYTQAQNPNNTSVPSALLTLKFSLINSAEKIEVAAPTTSWDILCLLSSSLNSGYSCPEENIITPPNSDYSSPISRDAKRIADIKQMQNALSYYYTDNGSYPQADSIGLPVGLVPAYMIEQLKAPAPPDGTCTVQQNYYIYSAPANGSTFSLTFCVGTATNGFSAGVHKVSPAGIE